MKVAIYANIGNQKGQDTEHQLDQLRQRVLSKYGEVHLFVWDLSEVSESCGWLCEYRTFAAHLARHALTVASVKPSDPPVFCSAPWASPLSPAGIYRQRHLSNPLSGKSS